MDIPEKLVDKSFHQIKKWYQGFLELQKHGPVRKQESTSTHICMHCNNQYEGDYCNVCGQKYDVDRITWSYVYQNIFTGLLNLGEGFLRTLIDLLYRPGYMIRDYLEGHRKPYFKPFQLLFVLSAIFLIYMQVTLPDELNRFKEFSEQGFNTNVMAESVDTTSMNEEQKNMIDYIAANYFKVANFISKIEVPPSVKKIFNMTKNWVSGNMAATILMLLPFWYLATKRTFRKTEYGKKMNGPERLVSLVYIGCQFILLTFIILFNFQIFGTVSPLTPFFIYLLWSYDHCQLFQISYLRALKLTMFMCLRIDIYIFIFAITMGAITMQLAYLFGN
jgi:hypothetical protein